MATIPTYTGPQVKERALEGGYQESIRSDAAFGGVAAKQLQQAGAAVTDLGEAFTKIQEREDADVVFRTETALKSEYLKFEDDIRQKRQGANAKGLAQDADNWWAEAESRFTNGLNERQKRLLSRSAVQLRAQSANSIRDYENQELERSHDESWSASKAVEARNAISNPKSEVVDTAVNNIKQKNAYQAARKGWTPERLASENIKDTTIIHREVLSRMLDGNSPEAARMYFEQNQKDIDPTFHDQIEKKLKDKMTDKAALQKADSIASLPYDKALEEVSKIQDPDMRDKTRQRVRENYQDKQIMQREQEAEKARKEKAASDAVWQAVANGKKPAQADLDAMDGKDRIQLNNYYEARAKAAVDKRSGKLHAKEDNYEALDIAESAINSGEITQPQQLERFAPFLRAETFRSLRKALDKRGEIPQTEVERSFLDRIGKPRSKWEKGDYEQWVAYQNYVNTNVKETKRPEDIDAWADKWFRSGYRKSEANDFFQSRMTMGEARTKGVADFVFKTPKEVEPFINEMASSMNRVKKNLPGATINVPTGKTAGDELYTNYYKDATVWFSAQGQTISGPRAAAYAVLKQNNKPITIANINAVIAQMKGQ